MILKKSIVPILIITLLTFALQSSPVESQTNANHETSEMIISNDPPSFERVVFITWDGVRPHWFDVLTENGTLSNINRVLEGGYVQEVRITNHKTSTDPGLICMETGYGPNITGIYSNMFGPGSPKLSAPDGYTTMERIKATRGDEVKTAMFLCWSFHQINEEHMVQQGNYTDTIFENIKIGEDVDYWFAAENLSWTPNDVESIAAAWNGYHEEKDLYYTPLIKASYLGERAADWIASNSDEEFYIRMHFTEPDNIGHGFGEADKYGTLTAEYLQALIECDDATGIVLDALEDAGILDNTLVIIGTDHGFWRRDHTEDPWPYGHLEVVNQKFAISHKAVGHSELIPVSQCDISPTIQSVMGVNLSEVTPSYLGDEDTGVPFWEREDNDAPIIKAVRYKSEADEDYATLENGSEILNGMSLSMSILEWSQFREARVYDDNGSYYEPNVLTSKSAFWDFVSLENLEEGTHVLHVSFIDQLNQSTHLFYEIELSIDIKGTPFSTWVSIATILVIALPIIYRRKTRKI